MSEFTVPPSWWANEKGWWRCDGCGNAINPKWKRGTPTPEVPVTTVEEGKVITRWYHRSCIPQTRVP